jgi:prophage regulatory protein
VSVDRILRLPEVLEAVGLSTATIYRLMADGLFPRPIQLTKRTVGWRASAVQAWIESREPVQDREEPGAGNERVVPWPKRASSPKSGTSGNAAR